MLVGKQCRPIGARSYFSLKKYILAVLKAAYVLYENDDFYRYPHSFKIYKFMSDFAFGQVYQEPSFDKKQVNCFSCFNKKSFLSKWVSVE